MKLIVVGGGGREHAIIKALAKSPKAEKIYVLPGNPGIEKDVDKAQCVNIGAKDIDGIVNFAVSNKIDFAVVAPDDPLALGAVDRLNEVGIPCFGPCQAAAEIESSKIFAKNLMKKYGIPTAKYESFSDMDKALAYVKKVGAPLVIKADGLALGKGVIIAMTDKEAEDAVIMMMKDGAFGKSGSNIVIEEFLEGPEVSVLSFVDSKTVIPMISSMDHKRALDNDKGLNTGGMGTIAPNPHYTKEVADRCMKEIFLPTVEAMNKEGRPFMGCLYFGLMITKDGPKVIEYNCRFGDPETQVVLDLLESDLLEIMLAVSEKRLEADMVKFADKHACCVIMASKGYPESYQKGYAITVDEGMDANIYYAGVSEVAGSIVNSGGRVLGVTATADTLDGAIAKAYENVEKVHFDNAFFRKDIGQKAKLANK